MAEPRPRRRFAAGRHPIGYLMILPCYSVYILFVLVPVIFTILYSFTNYDLFRKMDFVGLRNYVHLFSDGFFLTSVRNTLLYVVLTVIPPMALGLLVAVVLNGKLYARGFSRAAFYIPYIASTISISMIWLWIFDPSAGILNQFVHLLGLPRRAWLYDVDRAMGSIVFMSIWKTIGYNMVIYLAGLQTIPIELYEAARVDGASKARQFFRITIPMLRPTTFFLFVMACVNSFNVFDQINVMTQGGPMNATTTVVHQIYKRAFEQYQMGYASAMGVLLLVVTLVLTLLNFRWGSGGTNE